MLLQLKRWVKKNKFVYNFAPIALIFVFAFSLRLWNLGDAGRAWDEQFIAEDGFRFFQLAKNLDFDNDFWWKQNPDHPVLVRYVHGVASQFDFKEFDKNNYPILHYDLFYNRLVSIILTSVTAVIIYFIGKKYHSKLVGFFAAVIFSMLPILLGHSQIGLYEPFIVFFFTLCYFLFLLYLEKPSIKKVIIIGILSGLAIQAKETNVLLYPLYFLTYFIQLINSKKASKPIKIIPHILVIYAIGIITFFAIWPWAFIHLQEMASYIQGRRFDTHLSIPEVFFGKLMLTPRIYYVVMFLITTPLLILLFFFKGLLKINKSKNWIFYAFVLWFAFPFIHALYPNRQQGVRYIIEIYAPLSLVAAIGFDSLIRNIAKTNRSKLLLFSPVVAYLLFIIIKISPYYIDYFNEAVGGINNVAEKNIFQYGYWGNGIKEAAIYLETVGKPGTVGVVLSPFHIVPEMKGMKHERFNHKRSYDYVIVHNYAIIREGFEINKYIYPRYKLMHTVKVDKAPLVFIFEKK